MKLDAGLQGAVHLANIWRLMAAALLFFFALPAVAQTPIAALAPPMPSAIDGHSVDRISGKLVSGGPDVAIGPSDQHGLHFSRQWTGRSWRIPEIPTMSGSTYSPIVSYAGGSVPFEPDGSGGYKAMFPDGSTLSSDRSIFTANDGTQIAFAATSYPYYVDASNLAMGQQITYPDGMRWNFHYTNAVSTAPPPPPGCPNWTTWEEYMICMYYHQNLVTVYASRLSSITNSNGYQIKIDYAANSFDAYSVQYWYSITKVTALNNKVEYCNPTATTCSYANAWAQVNYSGWYDGKIDSVADPLGRTTYYSYTYLSSGNYQLTGIRPPGASSNTVTYAYSSGKVSSTTTNGGTWTYGYPSSTQMTVTDPASQTQTTNYNSIGLVTSTVAGGLTTSYGYCGPSETDCPEDMLKTVTMPEGNYVTYGYDTRGNRKLTTQVAKSGSGLSNIVTSAVYPSSCSNQKVCNKPTSTTDAKGLVTDYDWNTTHGGLNWAKAPADANGIRPETRMSYTGYQAYYKNGVGSIVASGITTYLPTQTASCRTTSSCTGGTDERRTVIAYGPQSAGTGNNLDAVTVTTSRGDGALAATATATYDNYGRVQTVDGPLGADTARIRYNLAGQVIGKVSPDPDDAGASKYPAQRISYDSWGHAYLVENGTTNGLSDGDLDALTVLTNSLTEYDGYGRPIRQKARDASNNSHQVTDVVYDALGRGQCSITRMDMGNLGTPSSCTSIQTGGSNGPDRVTYNSYDALGRVWKVTSGYGVAAVDDQILTFTNNGQVATVKDAENNLTTYVYDGHDRRTHTQYPNTTKGAGSSNGSDYEQVGYDANGNVTSFRTRRNETLTYSYDNLNRLLVKYVPERSGLSSTHTRDVYYEYDLFGGMAKARFDGLGGEGVTNYFNALGQQTDSTLYMDGVSRNLTSQYDVAGNRTALVHPDNNFIRYFYTGAGAFWVTNVSDASPLFHTNYETQGPVNALYRYDTAAANWTMYTDYWYDGLWRQYYRHHEFAGTTYDGATTLAFNPAGQISGTTRANDAFAWTGAANINRAYTSNGLNQYSVVGGGGIGYDGNGNLTSAADSTGTMQYYVYDVENRLVIRSATTGGATLRYDPLGRLYEVEGANGITRFLHDGSDLVAEYNSSGNLLRRYVHGLGGGDDPQVWFEGSSVADSARRYLYSDERGSVIAVTDSAGNVLNRVGYDEYGLFSESNASYASRFKYTGQAYIPELGMYYYKARMYSPTLGRFMQTDPIGYGDGMNMYAYVASDPVNGVDPTGLFDSAIVVQARRCAMIGAYAAPSGISSHVAAEQNKCGQWQDSLGIQNAMDALTVYETPQRNAAEGGNGDSGQAPVQQKKDCGSASFGDIRKELPRKGFLRQVADGVSSYIDGVAWGGTALAARVGLLGDGAKQQAINTNARLGNVLDQIASHPGQTATAVGAVVSKYPVQMLSRLGSGVLVSAGFTPYVGVPVSGLAVYGSAFKAAHQHPDAVAAAAVVGEMCQ